MHQVHEVKDLNLLTTLRHLLATGSVTATAERMSLSQPAVSRALARLRDALGDPLFVRDGLTLMPTARAEALRPELDAVLTRLDDLLATGSGFDPSTSRRLFVVATTDYTTLTIGDVLLARLAEIAPAVSLRFVQVDPDVESQLSSGSCDVLWGKQMPMSQAVVWTRLIDEDFSFVVRRGHPVASKPLTLERFLSVRQIALSPGGRPGNPLDERLERMGHSRSVVAHVPSFAVVPALIANSDLGAVLPRRVIERHGAAFQLVAQPLPFALAGFSMHQGWHERHRADPAHAWFRKEVVDVCRKKLSRGEN